ncbi:hypothetical protein ACK9YZ_14400 [Rhizobium sp. ZK1]|uniref:hypothetical protein n=1 Tax=Rhizobium sp. ZK1 TaxID=3389872 RepID=UPI0039F6754A
MKVKNLQRGTANAVALGEKPPNASAMSDMVVLCAAFNSFLCMSAMRCTNFSALRYLPAKIQAKRKIRAKKEGHRKTRALISVKVKNLQRGTANAVELGGKATVCISCVLCGVLMSKQQPFFVHVSHAQVA